MWHEIIHPLSGATHAYCRHGQFTKQHTVANSVCCFSLKTCKKADSKNRTCLLHVTHLDLIICSSPTLEVVKYMDAKHCMAWGAIEGNQTHLFASGSTGCQALRGQQLNAPVCFGGSTVCQALHGLGCNRRQSTSPGALHVQSKAIELTCGQALHGLGCNRWQSNSPACLGQHRMPSTAWHGVQSKAIELARGQALHGMGCNRKQSTSPRAKCCMAWGAIDLTRLLGVSQDAKHCMAWGAIKGNQTHPWPGTAWPECN